MSWDPHFYTVIRDGDFQSSALVGRQDAKTLLYNINEQHPALSHARAAHCVSAHMSYSLHLIRA